jgi:hypothetical protein
MAGLILAVVVVDLLAAVLRVAAQAVQEL